MQSEKEAPKSDRTFTRSERMEGLQQQQLLLKEQAIEVLLDQQMLYYMAHKALVFMKAKESETFTAMAEIKRKLAVMSETCEIIKSIDPHPVQDYCRPTGKYVFAGQMEQYANETRASLSKLGEQLREFEISDQEWDYYAAKEKLHDEIKALLEVVLSKLSQLYDQKMEELIQFDQERRQLRDQKIKELTQFDQEHTEEINDDLSAEDVIEVLINLTREIGSLAVDKEKKEYDELHAQLEVINSRALQLCDGIAIKKYQLKQHTKEFGKDDGEVFSIEEASESDDKVPEDVAQVKCFNAITWEKLPAAEEVTLAEIKKVNSALKILLAKLKVQHELQAHLAFTEKLNVFPKLSVKIDEEVPEMVRRIKKWELEGVNADTIIGLKEIGVDDKELWNTTEDRVATLNEAICYLVMMLRVEPVTD